MLFGYSWKPAVQTIKLASHLLLNPPPMDKKNLTVAGLAVNVFSLQQEQDDRDSEHPQPHPADGVPPTDASERAPKPVAMMFLLHGRTSRADHMELVAKAILDEVHERRKEAKKAGPGKEDVEAHDLWIATFDHRNHGSREVDNLANQAWSDQPGKSNDRHAIDMYAIQTGTAHDVSFLIDFLPSYLFPNGERTVSQWLVSGISLGGHSAWIALKNEPRVKLGIPIIGCPDYLALITPRAESSSVLVEPPYFPQTFVDLVKMTDPAAAPHTAADGEKNPFRGKKILVLSGQEDTVVPWTASKQFVEELDVGEGEGGVKEVVLEPGIGHTCSPAMIRETGRFLWENALVRQE